MKTVLGIPKNYSQSSTRNKYMFRIYLFSLSGKEEEEEKILSASKQNPES
jgi:hypothetical protein